MTLGERTLPVWFCLATACGAPAAPPPAGSPAVTPVSAPATDAPFRRKVVVIKEQGVAGDAQPVESGSIVASQAPVSPAPASAAGPASASCVQANAYAQYRSGYDHIVLLHNTCAKAADCQVSTDVNPTPLRVSVAPGATESVLTFRGSPASVFTPTVNCRVAP